MRKWWNLGENGGFLWSYTLGNWGFYLTLGWLNFMFLHQKSASARHPGPNRSRFQLFCDPALCPPFDGIFTGERFFRNAGPQEMWKRGPTVRPVVHQQALRWDNILHSLDVAVIVFQASVLVFWTGTLKIAAPGSHFCAISRQTVPKCTGQSIISMTSSEHPCNFEKVFEPALCIRDGEQKLCFRKCCHYLLVHYPWRHHNHQRPPKHHPRNHFQRDTWLGGGSSLDKRQNNLCSHSIFEDAKLKTEPCHSSYSVCFHFGFEAQRRNDILFSTPVSSNAFCCFYEGCFWKRLNQYPPYIRGTRKVRTKEKNIAILRTPWITWSCKPLVSLVSTPWFHRCGHNILIDLIDSTGLSLANVLSPKILRKDAHTMQDAPILSHTQCAAASNPVYSWLRAWSASLFGVVPRPRVWTHQPSGCKGTTTKAWSQPRPWQGHENLNKWTTRGVSVSEIYGHFWPDHLKKNNGKLENHQVCKWLLHWDDLTVTPRQELWKIFDYSCFFSFKFCLRIIVSLLWRLWCFFSGVFVAVGRLNLWTYWSWSHIWHI